MMKMTSPLFSSVASWAFRAENVFQEFPAVKVIFQLVPLVASFFSGMGANAQQPCLAQIQSEGLFCMFPARHILFTLERHPRQ